MVLSEYNPEWPVHFEKIKAILDEKLIGFEFRIEHFGSTSIKGLSAKPQIDLHIIIQNRDSFDIIKEKLSELGYHHSGDLGVQGREVFDRSKDKKIYNENLDTIVHNLYVCAEGNRQLLDHILFRDYLRSNNEALLEYEKLKQGIAERAGQDRKKYVMAKETEAKDFVNSIVEKAKKLKNDK